MVTAAWASAGLGVIDVTDGGEGGHRVEVRQTGRIEAITG